MVFDQDVTSVVLRTADAKISPSCSSSFGFLAYRSWRWWMILYLMCEFLSVLHSRLLQLWCFWRLTVFITRITLTAWSIYACKLLALGYPRTTISSRFQCGGQIGNRAFSMKWLKPLEPRALSQYLDNTSQLVSCMRYIWLSLAITFPWYESNSSRFLISSWIAQRLVYLHIFHGHCYGYVALSLVASNPYAVVMLDVQHWNLHHCWSTQDNYTNV